MAEAKRPVGRPTKYDPAMCDKVVECGREGMGRAEIAAELDISRDTLNEWAKLHASFSDAVSRAHDLSLAWWERQSRGGLDKGSAFNAALWGKAMSGRFPAEPYRERVEASGPGGGPIQTHSLTDKVGGLPKAKRDALREALRVAMEEKA